MGPPGAEAGRPARALLPGPARRGSGCEKDPGLQAEAQVLLQPGAEVGLALRLIQVVEGAHLRLVVAAAADLRGAVRAQLAVLRPAVPRRRQHGADAGRVGL